MPRLFLLCLLLLIAVPCAAESATPSFNGQPLDVLLTSTAAPPRFAEHRPSFSLVERQTHTFIGREGPVELPFMHIKDHDRTVAVMPLEQYHAGTLYLLTNDPAKAPLNPPFPTDRWHFDTAIGSAITTGTFIPLNRAKPWNGTEGEKSTLTVAPDGKSVTLQRSFEGAAEFKSVELKGKFERLMHTGRFVLSCDPVLGYVVDCTWETAVSNRPEGRVTYNVLIPGGIMNPWPGRNPAQFGIAVTQHDAEHPGGVFAGFALHGRGAHRANIAGISLADGGFAAFLDTRPNAFSPFASLPGTSPGRLPIAQGRGYYTFSFEWPGQLPKRDDGLLSFTLRMRQGFLPPEVTAAIVPKIAFVNPMNYPVLAFPIGKDFDEGFEQQPYPINSYTDGLAFPWGPDPAVSKTIARTGTCSLVIKGEVNPTLPQLLLPPSRRFRCKAWMKVEAPSTEELEAAKKAWTEKEEKRRQDHEKAMNALRSKGKETEVTAFEARPFPGAPAEGYIVGRTYEWGPGNWIETYSTAKVQAGSDWQEISFELESPAWGPYLELRFICTNYGTAYLDDFSFRDLGPAG